MTARRPLAVVASLAFLGPACAGAAPRPAKPPAAATKASPNPSTPRADAPRAPEPTMPPCTKTVSPDDAPTLDAIVASLDAGAVLCFQPGVYAVSLHLECSITLRATAGGAVLDARGAASTVSVIGAPDSTPKVAQLPAGQ